MAELGRLGGSDTADLVEEPGIRYCCVRDLDVSPNSVFPIRSATEMGFLSVTRSRQVAIERARRSSPPAKVLKLEVGEERDSRGADISAFSLTKSDHEVVYLPGAFLQYVSHSQLGGGDEGEPVRGGDRTAQQQDEVYVVEVSPELS